MDKLIENAKLTKLLHKIYDNKNKIKWEQDDSQCGSYLFQSENVWIRENNQTLPIKIKDSSFTYKTHLNDKLVNYTVQFEYAFDGINNIR